MEGFLEMELRETNILLSDNNERIWTEIGKISTWMNDTRRSIVAFEAVLRHNPVSTIALEQLGNIFQKLGKYENAISYYKKAFMIDPGNINVKENLLMCFVLTDKQKEGICFMDSEMITPEEMKTPSFLFVVGLLYERCGEYEKAENAYLLAIASQKNYHKLTETYIRLGVLFQRKKMEDTSLALLKHAEMICTECFDKKKIKLEMIQTLVFKKKYKEALGLLNSIENIQPTARINRFYGWIHCLMANKKKSFENAHQLLDSSIQQNPNCALTYYYKAVCYIKERKMDNAYEFYKKAMTIDPHNPALWIGIAIFYYKINKYHDALLAYSQALQIWPHESVIWYNVGILYESCNNQLTDAKDAYKRAVELDEKNEDAISRLEYLENKNEKQITPEPKEIDPIVFCRRSPEYYLIKE